MTTPCIGCQGCGHAAHDPSMCWATLRDDAGEFRCMCRRKKSADKAQRRRG